MNVPLNRSALVHAVVGSLCSGLVGTCEVSIVAQRRRVLSSHNMTHPPPTVLLEAQRTYDYAASASQTNLSASSSDMIAAGVASLGVRPTVEHAGRVLLETHCLDWPCSLGSEGGYGRCVQVDLLHKLHDELNYDSLDALREGIRRDEIDARAWLAAQGGR